MILQIIFSLIQFLFVPLTLAWLLLFKVMSNYWGKGEDIPLKHAQAPVADLVAITAMIWLMLFYLGGRYLWPTDHRRPVKFQVLCMVTLTVLVLALSLISHYTFTNSLAEFLQRHPNTWGFARAENYSIMLNKNPAWLFVMPLLYLAINFCVRHRGDKIRFAHDVLSYARADALNPQNTSPPTSPS